MNLKDAVKRVAGQHHAVIRRSAVATPAVATPAVATPAVATPAVATPAVATPAVATSEPAANMGTPSVTLPVQRTVRQSDLEKQARDERYGPSKGHFRARYDAVTTLHAQGVSQREMAPRTATFSRRLGVTRNTVAKLLNAPAYPGIPTRGQSQPQVAAPFHDYLVQRWNAGIHNIRQLQREMAPRRATFCEQGFTGNYSSLWNYVQPWRHTQPALRATKHPAAVPTPQQAAWILLTHPDKRTELQKQQVALWSAACPELAKTHDLAQAFGTLVRSRQADHGPAASHLLDDWINAARDSGIAIWNRFAASLKSDYAAVLNALKFPWSKGGPFRGHGPVEGHVQRLKLIKRQAYGRANLDLLKARVMQPA